MTRMEIRQYEMLVRVRDFGAARVEMFPEASLAGQAFAGVDVAIKQVSEHAVSAMAARPQRGGAEPTPRQALFDALQMIVRTARVIKAATPAFDNTFHLPRQQPSQTLIAVGRSFAREAQPVAALFVAHELPNTFIADLTKLVDRLETSLRAREALKDARTVARMHFETALASGLAAVRKLDVLIPNRLKDDPVTLAVWERDRRIDYPARAKGAAASPVSSSPAVPESDAA